MSVIEFDFYRIGNVATGIQVLEQDYNVASLAKQRNSGRHYKLDSITCPEVQIENKLLYLRSNKGDLDMDFRIGMSLVGEGYNINTYLSEINSLLWDISCKLHHIEIPHSGIKAARPKVKFLQNEVIEGHLIEIGKFSIFYTSNVRKGVRDTAGLKGKGVYVDRGRLYLQTGSVKQFSNGLPVFMLQEHSTDYIVDSLECIRNFSCAEEWTLPESLPFPEITIERFRI